MIWWFECSVYLKWGITEWNGDLMEQWKVKWHSLHLIRLPFPWQRPPPSPLVNRLISLVLFLSNTDYKASFLFSCLNLRSCRSYREPLACCCYCCWGQSITQAPLSISSLKGLIQNTSLSVFRHQLDMEISYLQVDTDFVFWLHAFFRGSCWGKHHFRFSQQVIMNVLLSWSYIYIFIFKYAFVVVLYRKE